MAYTVKQLVDAGWSGWESIRESKEAGACVPGNNMAMAALAKAVLRSLGICTCESVGPDMHDSRCALVRSGTAAGSSKTERGE